jgi:mitogen-activated protein kinase kinase 7
MRGSLLKIYFFPSQPERINLNTGYDIRADVWSLGISLVQLFTGTLPYADEKFTTEFALLTHIVNAPPPLPAVGDCSPEFYSFLSQW